MKNFLNCSQHPKLCQNSKFWKESKTLRSENAFFFFFLTWNDSVVNCRILFDVNTEAASCCQSKYFDLLLHKLTIVFSKACVVTSERWGGICSYKVTFNYAIFIKIPILRNVSQCLAIFQTCVAYLQDNKWIKADEYRARGRDGKAW